MKLIVFPFSAYFITGALLAFIFSCSYNSPKHSHQHIMAITEADTMIAGLLFVKVPAGPFLFGIHNDKKKIPYTYYIMKYEVTNAQYIKYLQEQLRQKKIFVENNKVYKFIKGIHDLPDSLYYIKVLNEAISYTGDSFILNKSLSNHPVISINWIGCVDFCRTYGLKLPNAYEWQKAARGMNDYDFPWGDDIDSSYANYWNSNDPYEPGTTPVGFYNGQKHGYFQTHDAVSTYGCYDMAGNAWEYLDNFITCQELGGAGGGFNYHTRAFLSVYSYNSFGSPDPNNIDRCDTADGFRAVYLHE